jgi:hypothetical protein
MMRAVPVGGLVFAAPGASLIAALAGGVPFARRELRVFQQINQHNFIVTREMLFADFFQVSNRSE